MRNEKLRSLAIRRRNLCWGLTACQKLVFCHCQAANTDHGATHDIVELSLGGLAQ